MNPKISYSLDWQPMASLPNETGGILSVVGVGADACYVAAQHGLWECKDAGRKWKPVKGPWNDAMVSAIATSPAFERDKTLLIATAVGILRTDDDGHSWTVGTAPRPIAGVTSLCLSPAFARDGVAFAGTAEDGVLRSDDGGRTWVAWNFGLLDLNVISLALVPDFGHGETLFAGTESGLFRSTNGGRAWREVTLIEDVSPVLSLSFSPVILAGMPANVLAGTEESGLFRSLDGGETWEQTIAWPSTACINYLLYLNKMLVAATSRSIAISFDDGETWNHQNFSQPILALGSWSGQLWAGTSTGGLWQVRIELTGSAHDR